MKKATPRKLTLSRETLRELTDAQAKEAAAGRPLSTNSVDLCCG